MPPEHGVPRPGVRHEVIGALNLFGAAGPPTDDDRLVAQALADFATLGIMQQRSRTRASWIAEQLQAALATRAVIEQAKGMLAEVGGSDMEQAFRALRRYAIKKQLKLRDVAHALVTGAQGADEVLAE